MATAANSKVIEWITGAITGILADKIVQKMPRTDQVVLDYVEHYHLAMAAYGVARVTKSPFATGLSTSMLVLEVSKDDPFGLNKDLETLRKNFNLAMILVGSLLLTG